MYVPRFDSGGIRRGGPIGRAGRIPVAGGGPMPMPRPGGPRMPLLGSFKKGGKVKKTGAYKLHKGEQVVPLSSLARAKK